MCAEGCVLPVVSKGERSGVPVQAWILFPNCPLREVSPLPWNGPGGTLLSLPLPQRNLRAKTVFGLLYMGLHIVGT